MRGIGHATEDMLRTASVQQEFCTSGQRTRSAKKCAPWVTTEERERKLHWGTVRPPNDMRGLQEAGVVERQVVHTHGMDGGVERMGIRRVQWMASPRPGGSKSARVVGRCECGTSSFELEAGREWEEVGLILRVQLPVREPMSEARWTMDVADAVHLVYEGVRHKTWRRGDGGLAPRRVPSTDSLVRNWWSHYCEETQRRRECPECVVHMVPPRQAMRVTVRLQQVDTPVTAAVMQGSHLRGMPCSAA